MIIILKWIKKKLKSDKMVLTNYYHKYGPLFVLWKLSSALRNGNKVFSSLTYH